MLRHRWYASFGHAGGLSCLLLDSLSQKEKTVQVDEWLFLLCCDNSDANVEWASGWY